MCYLGDTLGGDSGANIIAITRIRNGFLQLESEMGCMKF